MKKRTIKITGKRRKAALKIKSEKIHDNARIPTGIPGFDSLIEGGFEKNSINLVVGGSGSGKTIFAMQFLIRGIKNDETVLYITFEEKREEFFKNMLEFGWDLEELEKRKKFVFLEYSPEKVRSMLEEGGGEIESIVIQHKISRIVIDSISSFALLFDEEITKREAALSLFDIIRKWDCTCLLTLEEDPEKRREGASSSIEFESDSITFIYFTRVRGTRERFIEVLKMRGTKHSNELHPFSITHQGIEIGTKAIKHEIFK